MGDEAFDRREFLGKAVRASALLAAAPALGLDAAAAPRGPRISYYKDGQIHVAEVGKPEGTPVTTGHWDFKPSWSKTGNRLVFFRRLKDDPDVAKWITQVCIIGVGGDGFHALTDGTRTEFNPTWTRDGRNTPVWNRRNPATGTYQIMQGAVGGKPGEEAALTDERRHAWVFSSLRDGRLLVSCDHPQQGYRYFLMARKPGGAHAYEPIDCDLARKGLLDRVSVSPDETQVCFEFQNGFEYKDPGRTLYVAGFDAGKRTITGPRPIANEEGKPYWIAYPRWIDGGTAIVYHSHETGIGRLHAYTLRDGSTRQVSTAPGSDYRYPHGEAAPC
jgi:hypothetical protein